MKSEMQKIGDHRIQRKVNGLSFNFNDSQMDRWLRPVSQGYVYQVRNYRQRMSVAPGLGYRFDSLVDGPGANCF